MYTKPRSLFVLLGILLSACLYTGPGLANQANSSPNQQLNIVVTIAPFYNLVAAVSGDINQLTLLVPTNVSMHGYNLKPSDVTALSKADVIFWGGDIIEPFLSHAITHIPKTKSIIAFSKDPNILRLPIRNDPRWGEPCDCAHSHEHEHEHTHKHEHEHGNEHEHAPQATNMFDPHIWLSITNANNMVTNIANTLASVDPEHADQYLSNANTFKLKLSALNQELKQKFATIKSAPYIVFHDAYQYLEYEYGLNAVGAITINPELPASASRIQQIKLQLINSASNHGADEPHNNSSEDGESNSTALQCIFTEPQFQPKIVKSIVESSSVRSGVLDPLGQEADLGKDGYIKLLTAIANSLTACLKNQ